MFIYSYPMPLTVQIRAALENPDEINFYECSSLLEFTKEVSGWVGLQYYA